MASDVIDIVGRVLEELRPENLDPSAVTVTGEGDQVEIVIVPHRDLGGVSLVLWTAERCTHILWAGIGDLSTHDDIDLGVGVGLVAHDGAWIADLADALAGELRRPIRLKQHRGVFGHQRFDCYLVHDNGDWWLAALRPKAASGTSEPTYLDLITSLASGPQLPFSSPPPLENWRQNR